MALNEVTMKKVEAIIRKSKFKIVKKALIEAGFEYFSYCLVRDMAEEKEKRIYRGVEYESTAPERIFMTLVVQNSYLNQATKIIIDNGQTGNAGDGRIFVTALEDALRIQTGEHGDESIPYKKF